MLTSLHIKNYALIDDLQVNFSKGLISITGETGAGKSILLGGLSLVLGKRADISQVKQKELKCIVEATFNVEDYSLKALFNKLDIDYEVETIIRREILPSGKSRAFINDTPTTLEVLSELSSYLIDIHSQHQTQQLTNDAYQFKVIDALSDNEQLLADYSEHLKTYKSIKKALEILKQSKSELIKEHDYNLFLLKELESIQLDTIDLKTLETDYETLSNVETIEEKLNTVKSVLTDDMVGVSEQLNVAKQELSKISSFSKRYETLWERINSISIDLQDVLTDIDTAQDQLNADPKELDTISQKLQIINNLFQKHSVSSIVELFEIKSDLSQKVNDTENLDDDILKLENKLSALKTQLNKLAKDLRNKRIKTIPTLTKKLEDILALLGMPNARFNIQLSETDQFLFNGKDHLEFLFTANKGTSFNTIKKSASGGEQSRIMLAIKSVLAEYIQLPTIMFDEIDTGVSGEISNKMGDIMQQMSHHMQVFTITHLPQIASKGGTHFKVFKQDVGEHTQTQLKQLTKQERIVEIAQMLSGLNVTDAALSHAKQLLN